MLLLNHQNISISYPIGVLFYSNNARVYFLGILAGWKFWRKQGMGSLVFFFLRMIFTLKGGNGARRAPSFPVHKLIEPSFDGGN